MSDCRLRELVLGVAFNPNVSDLGGVDSFVDGGLLGGSFLGRLGGQLGQGGRLRFEEEVLAGGELHCVDLASGLDRTYYVCFMVGLLQVTV